MLSILPFWSTFSSFPPCSSSARDSACLSFFDTALILFWTSSAELLAHRPKSMTKKFRPASYGLCSLELLRRCLDSFFESLQQNCTNRQQKASKCNRDKRSTTLKLCLNELLRHSSDPQTSDNQCQRLDTAQATKRMLDGQFPILCRPLFVMARSRHR